MVFCDTCMLILDLQEAVYNSDQRIVEVKSIDEVYDIKGWLTPHIDTPHNHTNPHSFLFRANQDGKAEMFYRNWSSDTWKPTSPEAGLFLLNVYTLYFVCVFFFLSACILYRALLLVLPSSCHHHSRRWICQN